MFADEMDLLSLTAWRLTCKTNYRQAVSSFRRSLTARLEKFVPYPHTLVDIVNNHHAVFGGEFALSFILREDSYCPNTLEIFAADFMFEKICDAVLDNRLFQELIERRSYTTNTLFYALRRHIAQSLLIRMTNGSTIYIHQSYTASPTAPITRAPCTALSNYVSGYGFGCSHPRLTLHRRALLADQELPFVDLFDRTVLDNLNRLRFSVEVSPSSWVEYRRAPPLYPPGHLALCDDHDDDGHAVSDHTDTDSAPDSEECWRHLYICPTQGRFFGDKGSFVDFFDPLDGDEQYCVENNIAPFGPMVVWRVMSTFDCDEGCDLYDDVLEEGVTSIPVLFRKDPYAEIRELILDRNRPPSTKHRVIGTQQAHSV